MDSAKCLTPVEYMRGEDTITFRKTKEEWGGLSNMAAGYDLRVNNVYVTSSEALYQAMRFPDHPAWQSEILAARSPMAAKMASKAGGRRAKTRPDWDGFTGRSDAGARVGIMRWAIRVKLAQHFTTFGALLLDTGSRTIVEESHRDRFWGAVPDRNRPGALVGVNTLGLLLMELREEIKSRPVKTFQTVPPPGLPDFRLLGSEIERIEAEF